MSNRDPQLVNRQRIRYCRITNPKGNIYSTISSSPDLEISVEKGRKECKNQRQRTNTRKQLLNTKGRYADELTMVVTAHTNILSDQIPAWIRIGHMITLQSWRN